MALIEWREDFSIGVPEVDHEHRELIEMINAAHAELAETPSHDAAAEFLGDIHARIAAHFALEEKIMRRAGYDRLGSHKAAHEILLDDIRELMDTCETRQSPGAVPGAVLDPAVFGARLAEWFGEHFRTEDARLHGRLG